VGRNCRSFSVVTFNFLLVDVPNPSDDDVIATTVSSLLPDDVTGVDEVTVSDLLVVGVVDEVVGVDAAAAA